MRELYTYFVFSDVHGEYDALIQALNEAGYDKNNPKHKLVSCGDNFDRGAKSHKIYQFLKQNKAICVRGNHDNFFIEYLEKGMDGEFVLFNILHNGLGATIKAFTGINDDVFNVNNLDGARQHISSDVLKWLKSMPLYFETDTFLFVHAGVNPFIRDWKETDEHYMLWDIQDSHRQIPTLDKICVIGHHHASKVRANGVAEGSNDYPVNGARYTCNSDRSINRSIKVYGNTDENRPYINGNKIAIDGMTNLTGKVNVLVIEDYPKDDPQPEPVPEPEVKPDHDNITISAASYRNFGEVCMEATPDFAQWVYNGDIGGITYTNDIYTTTFRG